MANDVSLASTSAKVNFDMGNSPHIPLCDYSLHWWVTIFMPLMFVLGPGLSSPGTIATVLGVLVLIMVIGVVAFSYK